MLRRSLLAASLFPSFSWGAERKFVRSFFHDKDDVSSAFVDFAMLSPERGVALGVQKNERNGQMKGLMVATNDAGKTWTETQLKFFPISLFALETGLLWAVSADQELWFSPEGGRDWSKIAKLKNVTRVHFLDDKIGFAVGLRKTALRTTDGGRKWTAIPEAAQVNGNVESAAFTWVSTTRAKLVSLFGNTQAIRLRRRRSFELPDWMDPERARLDMEKPSLTISLDSSDAGATFRPSSVSAFGHVHRVRVAADGQGIIVMKFDRFFPYGGELYRFRVGEDKPIERILRPQEDTLQDALYIPGDGLYVALTRRANRMQLPVPGAVRILHSTDLQTFTEIAVDYRAEAQAVYLSAAGGKVWAATDEGMILHST